MTRFLVTGAGGMLGHDLVAALDGRDVVALSRAQLDVTDLTAVRSALHDFDVVVNAAAYTDVDGAEADEELAFAVNAQGAENLAVVAAENAARFVHFSTDYVFDGTATSPYPENAPLSPVSAYGRSKAEGERLVLTANPTATILRIAWLYGAHGSNFARTMTRLARTNDTVSVVTDQRGQPTWTADVAERVVDMVDAGLPPGVFHATNSGDATWFDFARAIFEEQGLDPERVLPTDSRHFVRPAPRPDYSVLGHDAWRGIGLPALRPWRDALADASRRGVLGVA